MIDAKFILSAASAADFPQTGLPEIALVGRSNVGKSSLINALVSHPIARTSAAPGKTRLANYYLIEDSFHLVDLPGYGYARGGEETAREFERLIAAYFEVTAELRRRIAGILHLVDARHPGLPQDADAHQWLVATDRPVAVVVTKVDKLTKAERTRNLKAIEGIYDTVVLPASVVDHEGLDDIWKALRTWLRPDRDRR